MDINKQDMNLDEAISVIKEIDPKYEITSSYKAESTVLNAVRNGEIVPVIRCKDCKWWDKVDNIDGVNYGTCERKCTAIRKDAFPNENWFCADGIRKEQEDETRENME